MLYEMCSSCNSEQKNIAPSFHVLNSRNQPTNEPVEAHCYAVPVDQDRAVDQELVSRTDWLGRVVRKALEERVTRAGRFVINQLIPLENTLTSPVSVN